jgi:ASC-1-like (ASCH) protein
MENFHKISINNNALNRIFSGEKKIEGRIKKGIFNNINSGDIIQFYNRDVKCLTKIINILEYKNILEYLSSENLNDINPNKTKKDILEIYKVFYPNILQESKSFLAIRFKLIEV